jgi:hypothetical protein
VVPVTDNHHNATCCTAVLYWLQAAIKRVINEFKGQSLEVLLLLISLQHKWTSEEKTARKEV